MLTQRRVGSQVPFILCTVLSFILLLFQSFSFTGILQVVKLTDGSGRYWITGSDSDPT